MHQCAVLPNQHRNEVEDVPKPEEGSVQLHQDHAGPPQPGTSIANEFKTTKYNVLRRLQGFATTQKGI